MMKTISVIVLAIVATFNSLFSQTPIYGLLSGANENPANASAGAGKVEGIFDPWSKVLAFRVDFSGLGSNAVAAHFHNAPAGSNGPVVLDMGAQGFPFGATSGEFVKVLTLTDAQAVDLMAGNLYLNIHTTSIPSGEIRAQLGYGAAPSNRTPISARLSGSQEIPANSSAGIGTLDGIFDPFSRVLAFRVEFSGLGANASAAHFHNAPAGTNGSVTLDLGAQGFPFGATSGEFVKVLTLTQPQADALAAGNLYINVHTPAIPSGEIRGQLEWNKPLNRPAIPVNGTFSGAQEVPPNASSATGQVVGAFEPRQNLLALKMNFSGLTANATAAHIHRAPAGTAGPVVLDLGGLGFPFGATSGNFAKVIPISAALAADLLAGNLYVNVHNPSFPGGEIRAQLNAVVLKPDPADERTESASAVSPEPQISIFPNPGRDRAFLKLDNFENGQVAQVQVFDAAGRLVGEKQGSEPIFELDTAPLLPGLYLFRTRLGESVSVSKWMKI